METGATAPVAPSSDVRGRLGTAPPPRRQPLESRLGRSIDQSQTSSQTISRTSNPPATETPTYTGNPSTGATPAEEIEPSSVLIWNRPDPSGWAQYKTDMSTNLNMSTLKCRLKAPVSDSLFAAYDTLDIKAAKYLIVASSDYLDSA